MLQSLDLKALCNFHPQLQADPDISASIKHV